jgi:glycosyltransferase involved in cell wall biosynthesis
VLRPIRVLHVTPYYEPAHIYGGPTYSVPLLCKALARAGMDVTVLTTDANGADSLDVPLATPVERDGVTVWYFPLTRPRSIFRSPALGKACRDLVPENDIVHITGVWTYPSWVASRASCRADKPYVVSPRGMLMPWELQHKGWKKRPIFRLSEYPRLQRSAAIHCTAPDEVRAMTELGLGELSFLLPNALDLQEFKSLPERGRFRARFGIDPDGFLMLFVGRLHPKKGIDLTLQAFERLATDHPKLNLALVGPDEHDYAASIPSWAREHGLSTRVHLTGQLVGADRLSAYADADLLVQLSVSENFGMSVAEAMAASIPVVVTEGVGISYWIMDQSAGIVVQHDVESASSAIHSLLMDPTTRVTMGANGRRLVEREFSPDEVGGKMARAYDTLLGTSAVSTLGHEPSTY